MRVKVRDEVVNVKVTVRVKDRGQKKGHVVVRE